MIQMTTDETSAMSESLTARAEELLAWAESLFGPKALTDWTFVGVEFGDQPPHLVYYAAEGWVAISLSPKIFGDSDQFIFQLAHEVAHLLYPTADRQAAKRPPTIILNEGVSTHFSLVALRQLRGEEAYKQALESLRLHHSNYFGALTLVHHLLQSDPEAIKKLRAVQPRLNDTVEQDFQRAGLSIEPEVATALIAVF